MYFKKGVAVEMKVEYFFDFKNNLGTGNDTNYPYISDISVFQVRKGSTKIYWMKNHSEV